VDDYTDRFETKMADYRKENPDVKEPYYIKCYINGLHAEIKHQLKSFEPKTLYQAVEHARNMEKSVNAAAQHHKRLLTSSQYQKGNYSSSNFTKPDSVLPRKEPDKITTKPETKPKEPNSCKYCGQR
jgi:hypothetical protein